MADFSPVKLGALHRAPPAAVAGLEARARLDLMSPQPADWFAKLPADGDALGNDRYGCCWPVARRWTIALRRANAAGDSTRPTRQQVLSDYSILTGFSQITESPDVGTDTRSGMTAWATWGVQVNSQTLDIIHWLTVDPTNDANLAIALGAAGPLMATWRVPKAMMDPDAWSRAPGSGADWETIEGEHETCMGATDGADGFTVRSWGMDLPVHPEIRRQFCLQVDVPLDLSPGGWMQATGLTPAGLDEAALVADMARVKLG